MAHSPCQNCERPLSREEAIDTGERYHETTTIFECPMCGARMFSWVPLFAGVFVHGWGWQLLPHQIPKKQESTP
jgi:predicted RNA-binding Zn-ribbon protein involved in translation (DUF1610 family)